MIGFVFWFVSRVPFLFWIMGVLCFIPTSKGAPHDPATPTVYRRAHPPRLLAPNTQNLRRMCVLVRPPFQRLPRFPRSRPGPRLSTSSARPRVVPEPIETDRLRPPLLLSLRPPPSLGPVSGRNVYPFPARPGQKACVVDQRRTPLFLRRHPLPQIPRRPDGRLRRRVAFVRSPSSPRSGHRFQKYAPLHPPGKRPGRSRGDAL